MSNETDAQYVKDESMKLRSGPRNWKQSPPGVHIKTKQNIDVKCIIRRGMP